jgi:S-adenosylmethionine:tRNA ribosyltransferase-isomerase
MSSRLSDYDYHLPRELIATRPLPQREDARMLVLYRKEQRIEHRRFVDLKEFLRPGDLFVLNNTRVVAARRFSDDYKIEFLFLERLSPTQWKCLVRPGKKMRIGATVRVGGINGEVAEICADGERIIAFEEGIDVFEGGHLPLPPYIGRQSDADDEARYQTVFADVPGALAAPTAGLHFTPEILRELSHVFVTLHVGVGTFRPVQTESVADHRMHAERFAISDSAAQAINQARRIIAVGTTSLRVLESARGDAGKIVAQSGETDLFIYPPYNFRAVDSLLTNFHLPRSTLLMLVSAFASREFVLAAYQEAMRQKYRFYSYGDCMLIV